MKGMFAALWQIGRRIVEPKATRQYPEERPMLPPRSRGRIILTSDPDGRERCVACGLCAAVCPVDCIDMAQAEEDDGHWFASEFRVNFARCIFCGLCEEACPTSAIQLTPDYGLSTANRASLVHEKLELTVSHQGKVPGYRYWAVAGKAKPADGAADPWALLP